MADEDRSLRFGIVLDRDKNGKLIVRSPEEILKKEDEGVQNTLPEQLKSRMVASRKDPPVPIITLWDSTDPIMWNAALVRYWAFVKPENEKLEKDLDNLDVVRLRAMDSEGWYRFLYDEYFVWKYTAANRLATTRKSLSSYKKDGNLDALAEIKDRLLDLDPKDTMAGLKAVTEIKGLGTAGGSGLLSLIYPRHFATVDQFVVKALCKIPDLTHRDLVEGMNPEGLSLKDGVILIEVLREKVGELNAALGTVDWTVRKLDMVLWTYS